MFEWEWFFMKIGSWWSMVGVLGTCIDWACLMVVPGTWIKMLGVGSGKLYRGVSDATVTRI